MAGCVSNDEFPVLGAEIAVCYIDCDALFSLCGQAIDKQCKVDLLTLCSELLAVLVECSELVIKDHLRFIEKPPD